MPVAEFKKKWLRYQGEETSAYQELRREWAALKRTLAPAYVKGKGTPA